MEMETNNIANDLLSLLDAHADPTGIYHIQWDIKLDQPPECITIECITITTTPGSEND